MSFHNELSYCNSAPHTHGTRMCVDPEPGQGFSVHLHLCVVRFVCPPQFGASGLLLSLRHFLEKKNKNWSSSISALSTPPVSLDVWDVGGESTTEKPRCNLEQLRLHIWKKLMCVREKKGMSWGMCEAPFIASQVHLFVFHTSFQLRQASSTGAADLLSQHCATLFFSLIT